MPGKVVPKAARARIVDKHIGPKADHSAPLPKWSEFMGNTPYGAPVTGQNEAARCQYFSTLMATHDGNGNSRWKIGDPVPGVRDSGDDRKQAPAKQQEFLRRRAAGLLRNRWGL